MHVICKYHAVASTLHVDGDIVWNGCECMTWILNKTVSSECCLINFIGGLSNKFCKTRENSNFLNKGKIVISVENRKFSISRMMKRIAPLNSSHEI